MKTCSKCGEHKELSEFPPYKGRVHFLCRSCKTAQNRQNRKNRNILRVEEEIKRRGGKCEFPDCEWESHLVWHHMDPCAKNFKISSSFSKTTGQLEDELSKCILLCPNHHAIMDDEVGVYQKAEI